VVNLNLDRRRAGKGLRRVRRRRHRLVPLRLGIFRRSQREYNGGAALRTNSHLAGKLVLDRELRTAMRTSKGDHGPSPSPGREYGAIVAETDHGSSASPFARSGDLWYGTDDGHPFPESEHGHRRAAAAASANEEQRPPDNRHRPPGRARRLSGLRHAGD